MPTPRPAYKRTPTRKLEHPWPFPVSAIPGRGLVLNIQPKKARIRAKEPQK